ncbi:MAG: hypothetical protein ACR2MT_06430 [Aurantibacter sp.]
MYKVILLFSFLSILSCQKAIDFDLEKKKIKAQMDLVDQAHHKKDAKLFYRPNAENWYDVRNGVVSHLSKSDVIPATQSYLDSMTFKEMTRDDNPIIEISDDGTLASYIGSVTVKGILGESPVFWIVSWQSVLKKINGEWKIISSANTEADKEASASLILKRVRQDFGSLDDNSSIYAYANCTAPEASFETLILSRMTDGKMEQRYGDHHVLLKHGKNSSWTYNLNTKTLNEDPNGATKTFIQGHELHWLSLRPEDRYTRASFKGVTTFNNQTAFNIEFTDALGKPINFYYSFDSYIPLGFELHPADQEEVVAVRFEDWEKINDISVFKKAFFIQGDDIFEYDFVDIKFDQLDDEDFETKIGVIK